jgi:hypothetical protein
MNRSPDIEQAIEHTRQALAARAQKRQLPPPRATQVFIHGKAMVQVKDLDTGRVLGFRRSYSEARLLAAQLERGELCA